MENSDLRFGFAANKLTAKILGDTTEKLVDILKDIAAKCGLSHIAYLHMAQNKSSDASVLSAVVTYSKTWQVRYFVKQYAKMDPTIKKINTATHPFDWETLVTQDLEISAFFADANRHNVGRNGISIPVKRKKNTCSLSRLQMTRLETSGKSSKIKTYCT